MERSNKKVVSKVVVGGVLMLFLAVNFLSLGFANPHIFTDNNKIIQLNTVQQKTKDRSSIRHKRHYSTSVAPFSKKASRDLLKVTTVGIFLAHSRFAKN